MAERKTLLKRYEIPLDHLDFVYIKKCNDAREMERIVHVLQSGEEGYFPDLTKCAEDKLRELKPNSRLFRCEEQLRRREDINANDVQPIYEFSKKVRDRDQRLTACVDNFEDLPPLRKLGIIKLNATQEKKIETQNATDGIQEGSKSSVKRISSTDYRKWDEYDPDVEILRMDLEEERIQEEVERKNRLNSSKSKPMPLITEIKDEEHRLKKLTDIERDSLAEEHRLRGNDYYRSKDYKEALAEYTRAVAINPDTEAAAYNNRALTNIKLKNFNDAMRDSEKCLSIEPDNVKAMYRLAESCMHSGFKEQALELFTKVLKLDPANLNAKNNTEYLRSQIGEKPPANATRLLITEESKSSNDKQKETTAANNETVLKSDEKEKSPNPNSTIQKTSKTNLVKLEPKAKDYDLSAVVRPKEIVPNRVFDTAANMFTKAMPLNKQNEENTKQNENDSKCKETTADTFQLRLPTMDHQNSKYKREKPLIQEI